MLYPRRIQAVLAAVFACLGCSRAPGSGDAVIVAHISVGPGVTATCIELAISDTSGASLDDTRLAANGKTEFRAGIYRGGYPATIAIVARALQGSADCTDPTTVVGASNSRIGTFVFGEAQTVDLEIVCTSCAGADGGATDGGVADSGSGDASATDAALTDAGPSDSGPPPDGGGADSGTTDAGAVDAGAADAEPPDAGPPDSGPPDAGPADAAGPDSGPACSPSNCLGCCDSNGNCQSSTAATCGAGGAACVSCVDPRSNCMAGRCTAAIAFPYQPSNFNPGSIPASGISDGITLNCGVSTFNSWDGGYTNWCGQPMPTPIVAPQTSSSGPPVAILPTTQFTVGDAGTLQIIGDKPVIIAVFGSADLAGNVYANAAGSSPGAGGGLPTFCGTSSGADGTTVGNGGGGSGSGGGGGGGGFSANGGSGGDTGALGGGGTHGNAGQASNTPGANLIPLRGGCSGGIGGAQAAGSQGGGGGAVQLSAASALTIAGNIAAAGGGGAGGTALALGVGSGGAGGGSGGAILLEGNSVALSGSPVLTVNGGGGGEGGGAATANGNPGAPGDVATGAQAAGGSGGTATAGPGGAGGARIGGAGTGSNGFIVLGGGGEEEEEAADPAA